MSIQDRIKQDITQHPVLLYMKGNVQMPLCGFSARAVEILKKYNVPFATIDVLQDEALRQGVKEYSNWPTLPQLYVKGEFVGGCDIMTEMHEAGELRDVLSAVVAS
jgi:monothiol glutaredoxin